MAVRDDNGVPVLAISQDSHAYARAQHDAALDPNDPTTLLTGAVVVLHNRRPIGSDTPDVTTFRVGGSTLWEAATEVIGGFEFHAHLEAPAWVASSNGDLARILAEHYDCPVRAMEEELIA